MSTATSERTAIQRVDVTRGVEAEILSQLDGGLLNISIIRESHGMSGRMAEELLNADLRESCVTMDIDSDCLIPSDGTVKYTSENGEAVWVSYSNPQILDGRLTYDIEID